MLLSDFIEQLKALPKDLTVMVASDSEGNSIKDYEGWGSYLYNEEDEGYLDLDQTEDLSEEELGSYKRILIIYPY